jgi:hypothetical protein
MKEDDNDIDDSFLKGLAISGGFSVPENYFEKSIMGLKSITSQPEPLLNIKNKEGGFEVPENYFEKSANQILEKVGAKQGKKIHLNTWFTLTKVAAVLIAIIGLSYVLIVKTKQKQTFSEQLNNVSEEEIIDYLAKNDVKTEWITKAVFSSENQLPSTVNSKNKEVEQYLIDNTDEQTLIEEL